MSDEGTHRRWPRVRRWLITVGLPGFLAASAYVLQGAFRERWPDWLSWILLGAGGLLTFGTLGASGRAVARETDLRLAAEKVNQDVEQAVAKYRQRINDGLRSFVTVLDTVVNAPNMTARRARLEAMIEATVNFASARLGTERTRACFFSYTDGPPRSLIYHRSTGRNDQPRPKFVDDTPDGVFVFSVLDSKKGTQLWPDVELKPPPGSTEPPTYRTFITAKVASADKLFGMLGVDSPEVGALTEHDEIFVGIIAQMLGIALAAGNRRPGNSNT